MASHFLLFLILISSVALMLAQYANDYEEEPTYIRFQRSDKSDEAEALERSGRTVRLYALNRLLKKPVFQFSHLFKKEM
ncbi:unnamed protein product [Auanema sp. JU1783]|nr:unnamed protein product [Auanema sp. JU1783]